VQDRSVYLEEFCRTQIAQEEMHGLELRKMVRDISVTMTGPIEDRHQHEDTRAAKKAKAASRTKKKR
jgi:hypothetical protein